MTLFICCVVGNGELFLKCPLFGQLPKCLIFYRFHVPFRIPCKALHPDVNVLDHTSNAKNVI